MKPEDKLQTQRLLLAVVLSLAILFGFEFIAPYFTPKDAPKGQSVAAQAAVVEHVQLVSATATVNQLPAAPPLELTNGLVRAGLNPAGGQVDPWVLTQYTVTHGDVLGYPQLHATGDHAERVAGGWEGTGIAVPDAGTAWTVQHADQAGATLAWANGSGQTFTRTVRLQPDGFSMAVSDTVANAAGLPVTVAPVQSVSRADGAFPGEHSSFVNHLGPMGVAVAGGKPTLHEENFDDLKKHGASEAVTGSDGWWGLASQYFLTAVVPLNEGATTRTFSHAAVDGKDVYTAQVKGAPVAVPPGGSVTTGYIVYVGPKQEKHLLAVGHHLDWAIDWGWFAALAKPFYHVLLAIQHYVGNWGVAIFLLTLLLKIVTFPLANKSYHAMAKMKKLQPKMEELKARYKDDQAGLATAMMKLYRDHKVNPLSGCWPMLIQIPIFFAMYKVVLLAFEFRHAELGLWIHDLSVADPWFVLPLLMGASMFVQQQLNPPPADPAQAQVFKWMPVIFTFMFLWFPAALVFYWLTNNVLSIAQQAYIMRKDKAI